VSAYKRAEDGRLTLWRRSRAVPADMPAEGVSSSSIVIAPDGRHVYAGIRGPDEATNAIACYAVAADGSLTRVATLPWDGQIPDVIAR
jgi:6-phosphogluconolactonase (cycloisomerase 2 family)